MTTTPSSHTIMTLQDNVLQAMRPGPDAIVMQLVPYGSIDGRRWCQYCGMVGTKDEVNKCERLHRKNRHTRLKYRPYNGQGLKCGKQYLVSITKVDRNHIELDHRYRHESNNCAFFDVFWCGGCVQCLSFFGLMFFCCSCLGPSGWILSAGVPEMFLGKRHSSNSSSQRIRRK